MSRLPRATQWSRQYTKRGVHAVVGAAFAMAACVHAPRPSRPAIHVSYWEALAELHPVEAAAAARTESERSSPKLWEPNAGDVDKQRVDSPNCARRRRTRSSLRIESDLHATLHRGKWTLWLPEERARSPRATNDKASSDGGRSRSKCSSKPSLYDRVVLADAISVAGTPLVPVRLDKNYNFGSHRLEHDDAASDWRARAEHRA